INKYLFMFQQFVIQQFEINYRKIKQLETEGKIRPNAWILFDRSKNDFWQFTWLNIKDPRELEELTRFYKTTSTSFNIIPTDIQELYHMIGSLFIHEAKGLRRIEERPITPAINEYIKKLPITGYTLITPFKFRKKKTTDKTYREGIKREALEGINLEVNDYKLQLYMVHKYLSKNHSGTDPVL
ncbi:4769_t:CDS:2, partial [Gigaspora rosea]